MTGRPTQRGVVFPSPVVMLSIIAVALAAVAFVATRGGAPTEREVAAPVRDTPSASASASPSPTKQPTKKPKPAPPKVERGKVYVDVYNNTGVSGLASDVATTVTGAGWKVVGTDNWYGVIPQTTVYYPERLAGAGKQLALDLGVKRTMPSVGQMSADRLTLILTDPL